MTNGTSNLTAGEHRTGGRLFASDIDWWTVGIYLLLSQPKRTISR